MAFVHMKDSGVHMVAGKFTGGTSPAVSVGKGFTVSYSATGQYIVTIKGAKPKAKVILHAHASVWDPDANLDANDAFFLTATSADNDDGTVTFQAWDVDTDDPTAADVNSSDLVSFVIIYSQATLVA